MCGVCVCPCACASVCPQGFSRIRALCARGIVPALGHEAGLDPVEAVPLPPSESRPAFGVTAGGPSHGRLSESLPSW